MEKANVENAREAARGAPSPLNVLAMTDSEAPATSSSDQRSAWPRLEDILMVCFGIVGGPRPYPQGD